MSTRPRQSSRRPASPTLIGMAHLQALPGSPGNAAPLESIIDFARRDAATLAAGGVNAIMVENFCDVPFYPGTVPPVTIAAMTAAAIAIKRESGLPIGVNVLRNDGRAALAVALASGASFIRVNVLCGARLADQGILHGIAHDLLRDRKALSAGHVRIYADVDVKHSAPLAARPLRDEIEDTLERGMADAIVVSGAATGKPTDIEQVRQARQWSRGRPVFVGSGITPETVATYAGIADGFIVGTSLKRGGRVDAPVDLARVRKLARAIGN